MAIPYQSMPPYIPPCAAALSRTPVHWGVILQALHGHAESGDQYFIKATSQGVLVVAIDGLGHGEKAAVAAKSAVEVLDKYAEEPLPTLVNRCHKQLVGTRGVVMSLALFDTRKDTITWLGIGNVQGVLLRANGDSKLFRETLLLRGGTVGYRIPTLRPETRHISPGDTLIFVSDGIRSGFANDVDIHLSPQQIAGAIYEKHARGTDDTLVLVVRYAE